MVQSNGNGNGEQREYNPEVEFEYLDADVWFKKETHSPKTVAYTDEVLEALGEDDEESSDSDSND